MFGIFKKLEKEDKVGDGWAEVEKLDLKVTNLETENINLKGEILQLKTTIENMRQECRNAPMTVDFKRMNIVSIERIWEGASALKKYGMDDGIAQGAKTSLGYVGGDNVIHEWVFFCSDETHKKLYDDFMKYRSAL